MLSELETRVWLKAYELERGTAGRGAEDARAVAGAAVAAYRELSKQPQMERKDAKPPLAKAPALPEGNSGKPIY